jgi:hypothetical protein
MIPASWLRRIRDSVQNHRVISLLISSAVLLFGLLALLSHFPQWVESLYARRVYAVITKILSPLSALVPFSLSEMTLYFGILGAIVWGFRGIWRRRIGRTARELLAGAAMLMLWFYLAWGLNYLRPQIEQQLNLVEIQPDSLALRENFSWCIEISNARWQQVPPWDLTELDEEIERCYADVFAELSLPRLSGRWPPKFLLLPAVLDYTMTSGIFGPFFHEVHLNSHLLPVELPFVLAHEKAHAFGFARESEASFLAALVCFQSPDNAVRYSACFSLLGSAMMRYFRFADADSLRQLIRPEITADFDSVRARLQKYSGPIAEFAYKGYDFYLRANQVEGGMENYADVVDLVIRWRKSQKME